MEEVTRVLLCALASTEFIVTEAAISMFLSVLYAWGKRVFSEGKLVSVSVWKISRQLLLNEDGKLLYIGEEGNGL